jgi:hypothetical protein
MPADHYRRRAAEARRLAGEATTPAVKEHLRNLALQFLSASPEASMRSVPADDLIGGRIVGRPLPSLGHGEEPPVCQWDVHWREHAIPRMYKMSGEL